MDYPLRRHTEVLREVVAPLEGAIVDIGCGRGALAGWFRKQGMNAVGIDPQAALRPSIAAMAESLPLADESLDIALFFNSLHHVPVAMMDRAIAEASRVVQAQGRIVVVEPLAEGRHFRLMQPLEDETGIRGHALAALRRAVGHGLRQTHEIHYDTHLVQTSLDEVIGHLLAADPQRAEKLHTVRESMECLYRELGTPCDQGMVFNQPMRLNVLMKDG
ncbi:MAG: class I SAM-dependent methyltransferase [Geminicoccaceae bacterium]|nr:class I SAM-dependent methyltransferase [Geminicoccaceae bacterium]